MLDSILPANTDTCLVEFDKKEYAIVGDLFFAKTLEEVPPWFQELVQGTVVQVNGSTYDTLAQYNISLLAALQGIEVSKNTYDQYINKLITDQEAFISVLTTLNSTINGNDASIRQLLQTYATEDFAVASAAQLLTASLNGGAIGAAVGSVETAMATQYGAMAQRLQTLETTFTDVAGQQGANASAIQALTTYTGYGVYNGADALIANSNFYNNLNAYLDGTDYNIGGSSTLLQDVTAISTEQAKIIEAKFEYGSTIELGGKQYNAGFGLVQTGTLLPDGTTYDSEFWVKASRFKFVADDGVTVSTPFQISGNTVYVGWDAIAGSTKPEDGATRNVNRGTWAGGISYAVGDIVQYNGSSYTNKLATNNVDPTNTSYWALLASQGPAGATGATGPQGPTGSRGTAIGYGTSATNSAFTASTGLSPIYGDQLVVTNSSGTIIYTYNGSSWGNSTVLQVHGDAVISGTLSANRIVAGSITVDKISSTSFNAPGYTGAVFAPGYNAAVLYIQSPTGSNFIPGLHVKNTNSSSFMYHMDVDSSSGGALYAAGKSSSAYTCKLWNNTLNTGIQTSGPYGIKVTGGVAPFTGCHDALISKSSVVTLGDIVVVTEQVVPSTIMDSLPIVQLSSSTMDSKCFGVVSVLPYDIADSCPILISYEDVFTTPADTTIRTNKVKPEYMYLRDSYFSLGVNSLGEGSINVCGLGGDLVIGDYVTTSSIPGKAQKQTDDILHSYTVAKVLDNVVFDYPEQVKLVACTYHCG